MKWIFNGIKRFIVMWHCAFLAAKRCFIVAYRARSNKASRRFVSKYLHLGGKEILKAVNASCHVTISNKVEFDSSLPIIFMSNHLSLFDLLLLTATVPHPIRVVIKKELTRVPFLGKAALASEQVIIDRKNPDNSAFYKEAAAKVHSGIGLWIFPEGTRSRSGELLPFKMGGFKLAQEIKAIIIPVGIRGTDKILPPGKLMPHLKQRVEIRLGDPIVAADFDKSEPQLLLNRVRAEIAALSGAI